MVNKREAEINSSSLADIAFLLLMFFLVTTTINVDTGIGLVLPPPTLEEGETNERNVLNVFVNEEGQVLLDDKITSMDQIKDKVVEFVDNHGANPELSDSPQHAIILLKTQRDAVYKTFIDALDEVKAGYKGLRNAASLKHYGKQFSDLEEGSKNQQFIRSLYPQKISIDGSEEN